MGYNVVGNGRSLVRLKEAAASIGNRDPWYLQGPAHYSPLRTGLAFLPIALPTFTGSLAGTRLVRRMGGPPCIMLGAAVGACGLFWLAAGLGDRVMYPSHLLGPLILYGLGVGFRMAFIVGAFILAGGLLCAAAIKK
jgi:hypothetical protein